MRNFAPIIYLMFCITFFTKCHQTKTIAPTIDSQIAYITMDNTQVLYHGYSSLFEYGAICPNECKPYIEAEGGSIAPNIAHHSNKAILKADSLAEKVTLKMYCVCNTDSTLVLSKQYPVMDIPHPAIYYGGVPLTDYTIYNDTVTFNTDGIRASYAHVPGLISTAAHIYDCSYTYKGKDYRLNGIRRTFHASIMQEMKAGETIQFNYIKMRYADGRTVTIQLKREIIKVTTIVDNQFILR